MLLGKCYNTVKIICFYFTSSTIFLQVRNEELNSNVRRAKNNVLNENKHVLSVSNLEKVINNNITFLQFL